MYIWQHKKWPSFNWDNTRVIEALAEARSLQGRILGRMEGLGFSVREESVLENLTNDVIKTSKIEGESLNMDEVRSSIAKRLGMNVAGMVNPGRNVEGIVELMLDATQNYKEPLSAKRLFGWHAALFPTGYSGMFPITVGKWRNNEKNDPMQVVSGAWGKQRVHFEAPASEDLKQEMKTFIQWFNSAGMEPVLKSALAHLWFVTLHPFDDGNGRIARAIADMQLARADRTPQRFYSMSAQIEKNKKQYYTILEKTQKGNLTITEWLLWYIDIFTKALQFTEANVGKALSKAGFWEKYKKVEFNSRQIKMLNKLMSGFDGNLTTAKWAKINKSSQDTALRDINELVSKKVLRKESAGSRSTHYTLVL